MRKLMPALALLLALFGVGGFAAPASAHASLVETDPAEGEVVATAPDQVTFTFSEAVSLVPKGIAVFDAAGEAVEVEDTAARDETVTVELPELAEGTFVVTWRIVSADGHPVAGSLTFHVGARSAQVVPPQQVDPGAGGVVGVVVAVVSGVNYVALLIAGGLLVFVGHLARGVRLPADVRRRLGVLARTAAPVAVLSALLAVPLAGIYQSGGGLADLVDPAVWDPALVRNQIIVLVAQAAGLGWAMLGWTRTLEGRRGLTDDLAVALAVWSPALVGHTRAYEPSGLLVITDATHLSAGAIWLGGLLGLLLVLPAVRGRPRDAGALVTRFSTWAAGALVALAVSGTLLGWRILGSWSGLVETTYGRLLLVKLGIAVLVVGVAAWNRFRLMPGLEAGGPDQTRAAVRSVRRTVVGEATLLVVLLGVTGFLVDEPPSGESEVPASARTGVVSGQAEDYQVYAVLDDATGRQRQLTVQIQDAEGEPIDLYQPPTVALSSDRVDLGAVPVEPTGAGTYLATVVFPHTGAWELRVSVRIDEFTTPVTTLELDVADR